MRIAKTVSKSLHDSFTSFLAHWWIAVQTELLRQRGMLILLRPWVIFGFRVAETGDVEFYASMRVFMSTPLNEKLHVIEPEYCKSRVYDFRLDLEF